MAQKSRLVLSEAIKATLAAWIVNSKAVDAAQINSGSARGGCCSDFPSAVVARLGGANIADTIGIASLGRDNFQVEDADDSVGRPFDRPLLLRHWPKVRPPGDLDWDDLDQLSKDAGFSGLTHTWLETDGMHFDAEAPEGVENLFDLPIFQRIVRAWVAEKEMPTP
jgi:hypothetical protein